MKEWTRVEEQDLPGVADEIISYAGTSVVILLEGEMGVGKTTLVKAICHHLEVVDNVNSPTFSIINEYLTARNQAIYHFDFYRIQDEREALDIGAEEYFFSGNLCLIEWPERITSLIPDEYVKISIILGVGNTRSISLTTNGR